MAQLRFVPVVVATLVCIITSLTVSPYTNVSPHANAIVKETYDDRTQNEEGGFSFQRDYLAPFAFDWNTDFIRYTKPLSMEEYFHVSCPILPKLNI